MFFIIHLFPESKNIIAYTKPMASMGLKDFHFILNDLQTTFHWGLIQLASLMAPCWVKTNQRLGSFLETATPPVFAHRFCLFERLTCFVHRIAAFEGF